MTAREIWDTLSNVDCSAHIEKKGNLSYLSWAWAWDQMMEHFPDADIHFPVDVQTHDDGSVTVWCRVSIGDVTRWMWLPVMDHRNNAIQNPDARAISDARMRCMVKCFALFGLGHYIYAGEDLPVSKPMPEDDSLLDEAKGLWIRGAGLGLDEHKYMKALDQAVRQKDRARLEKGVPMVRKLIEKTESAVKELDLEKVS